MKNLGTNQSGIAHVVAILVVVVIAVAGFAGWKVWKSNDKKNDSPAAATSTTGESSNETTLPKKISVAEEGKLILPNGHADPTVVATEAGYRMYVNRQSGGPSGILIYTSADGVAWTKEKDIIIPGASTSRAVVLPNGVRLYYPGPQPLKDDAPQADMYSAFSSDGVNFTKEAGTVIQPRSSAYYVEGPTVFQLADKTWRMYFNENTVAARMQRDGEIWGASSKDGTTWTRDTKVTMQAGAEESQQAPWKQLLHPFVLKNPKGGYIMFYNSHSEMYAATSTDGMTWKKIGKIGIHGADMDGYFQSDGTIRAYYGDFSPQTGGVVYSAVLKVD
jgi:sucrose-6-phosphate hydrolase SacC (GH32 family)